MTQSIIVLFVSVILAGTGKITYAHPKESRNLLSTVSVIALSILALFTIYNTTRIVTMSSARSVLNSDTGMLSKVTLNYLSPYDTLAANTLNRDSQNYYMGKAQIERNLMSKKNDAILHDQNVSADVTGRYRKAMQDISDQDSSISTIIFTVFFSIEILIAIFYFLTFSFEKMQNAKKAESTTTAPRS